jgi:molybdopterin-containing oxidoreductase family iron-sulfur binding subunit
MKKLPELPVLSGTPPLLAASEPNGAGRPVVWRSLEELSGAMPAEEISGAEFLERVEEWLEGPNRRDFLRVAAASLALAGASGCAYQPAESIVPYVQAPEEVIPGRPLFFASAVPIDGFACGVLVKSEMGRPIKIEGNPAHPASLGATDIFGQAALLGLYDPDRSQLVTRGGRIDTWEHFQTLALDIRETLRTRKGAGLRILTQTVASPTLADQLRRLFEQFPEARWHAYEPISRDSIRAGSRMVFGEDFEPVHHLEKADVIVSLDADFLGWGPGRLKDARAFAARRDAGAGAPAASMNRLYVAECTLSLTGAAADHRLAIPAWAVASLARALAAAIDPALVSGASPEALPEYLAAHAGWIKAVASDLTANRGKGLVIAGEAQPAEVHALAHLINHALGNIGKTVEFFPRADAGPSDQIGSLRELARDIEAGLVETLFILGGNPAFDAPADLGFERLLRSEKTKLRIHLGLYDDETARLCHWHIPQAHSLESWSDLKAFDGTATIQQPLIAPLYKGRSEHELLALLLGQPDLTPLEIVRDYWKRQGLAGDFEVAWRDALETGVVKGTAQKPRAVVPKVKEKSTAEPRGEGSMGLEIVFRPDPTIWDGRYANNGWLQELPKPLTKLSWDSAALLSPATAGRLGVKNEDVLELSYGGRSVRLPAWIMPGQADQSITVFLGHGRRRSGRVGTGVGVDVYGLRTSGAIWFGNGLEVKKTDDRRPLAAMHHHFSIEGRDLFRAGTALEYRKQPDFLKKEGHQASQQASLIDPRSPQAHPDQRTANAWGMVIDLNTCIGCLACVVACQAENNIPVVGREQVLASREMHWLRIDRYFEGEDAANPKVDFQPVPCMHCEKAPCEVVCPTGATTHSAEGLNEMTYNRCVGTRYCSNNCPYKVRRFNFFNYVDEASQSLKFLRNPDVTVRARGVMEKCTYCVQRINSARIAALMEDRPVGGDEVVTACQGACPARAITFGNLNDPQSAVAKAKAGPRNYALLEDLNTRPRTTYLAKLRNPNPEIEASPRDESHRS